MESKDESFKAPDEQHSPAQIVCLYAMSDEPAYRDLKTHLVLWHNNGSIRWLEISAGSDMEQTLFAFVQQADLILLLISASFFATGVRFQAMEKALAEHAQRGVPVVPVLARAFNWKESSCGHLKALPENELPIAEWEHKERAYENIRAGIACLIPSLAAQTPCPEHMTGKTLSPRLVGSSQGFVQCDWGEAPDVPVFFGRTNELLLLEQWLLEDRCRLVALVGMKGIGKTDLSLKLARGIEAQFDYVIWRRLLNAPKVSEILTDLIKFLSNGQGVPLLETVSEQISRLLHYFRTSRCLVILDNAEKLLQGGKDVSQYLLGYEEYGQLFEKIAKVPHQSSLLLTSREKMPEVARLESTTRPVRSLEVRGLNVADGEKIFAELGSFSGSEEDWEQLNQLYVGNPLALELAARHIKEVFFESVSDFLREGKPIFVHLRGLLDWHFSRLSASHKEVMYWLAINREPTSLAELKSDILSRTGKEQIASTLDSLQRLIPLEKSTKNFTLQPVLIEYMTEQFIEQIVEEVSTGEIRLLNTHALLKTSVSDYVRDIQSRLILQPIEEKLLEIYGNQTRLKVRFKEILSLLRERFCFRPGYAGGNVLNLLCHLEVELRGYDFSTLSIWQAYLRGVNAREVNFAHTNFANSTFTDTFGSPVSVAFCPHGDLLAIGTVTGEIRLWHPASGGPLPTFQGHSDYVRSIAFSSDGQTLASSSDDRTVRLWEVSSGRLLHTLRNHNHWVFSVAFSPDGQLLASGSSDQTVCLWEVSSERLLDILSGHVGAVWSVAFSPDGQTLASGSFDKTVRLWEVSSGQLRSTLSGHTNAVSSVALSPDGQTLASGSHDQTVRLWEVSSGRLLHTLSGHNHWIRSVAFSPDGQILASGGDDRTVRLWEMSSGRLIHAFQDHTSGVCSVALSPNGQTLASVSSDQTIRLWGVNSGRLLQTLRGYTNAIFSVAFSPDSQTLASGSEDHAVRLWEVNSETLLRTLPGHNDWVRSVVFSPHGATLASGSCDRTVRLWEVSSGTLLRTLLGHASAIISVAFSPDGEILASGSHDQTVRLWEVSSGRLLGILPGHVGAVWSVAFSPDGQTLASGSDDQTICLWKISNCQCFNTVRSNGGNVNSLAFSPDGKTLASANDDQAARLWDVNSGALLHTLQGHAHGVWSVAFSPDGQTLASGSNDQAVRLWDVNSGELLRTLRGHRHWVISVAFSPDGQILVSGSHNGEMKLWSIQTGACLRTLRSDRPYERMNITQVEGLTEAEKATLKSLGAIEEDEQELSRNDECI